MDFVQIFPTIVGIDTYFPKENKSEMMESLMPFFDENGRTGETRGFVHLQTVKQLAPIYDAVAKAVKEKLEHLKVNSDLLDVNIVKSWMNVVKEKNSPVHTHADCHWSFTYYLNVPPTIDKAIMFEQKIHPNDVYGGMLRFSATEYNENNALSFIVPTTEGMLLVFPSNLLHSTVGQGNGVDETHINSLQDLYENRVCIAGDILFTYKKTANIPLGLQPKESWLSL